MARGGRGGGGGTGEGRGGEGRKERGGYSSSCMVIVFRPYDTLESLQNGDETHPGFSTTRPKVQAPSAKGREVFCDSSHAG